MNAHQTLNSDGQVLLALCSGFALPAKGDGREAAPFTLAAWNQLARQIQTSALKRPAALQGKSAGDLARELSVPEEEAGRIVKLLDRSGRLALELESLFAQGMWTVTRADEFYPPKLKANLKAQAPTVLFGAGEVQLLRRPAVGIVGSRNIDEPGAAFARELGRKAVASGMAVVSGGARGTDRLAMEGALDASGISIGVLADSLERTVAQPDLRQLLLEGKLVFVTPYIPTAGFSVGAAMGRNKIIYGLSDYGIVVSSEFQTGGTWAGATEALKSGSCPVFVRDGEKVPKGNRELLKLGANVLPEKNLSDIQNLSAWLQQNARKAPVEGDLFSPA
jgi:predicted Rossmann fold nucleotide-binding protein DprA/Smf involved in DNA uptake